RLRQRLVDAVDEPVPAAPDDRVTVGDRALVTLGADIPARVIGLAGDGHGQPGAGQLRERVGLVPVDPGAAVFDRVTLPGRAPRAAAEPGAGLQHSPAE